MAMVPGNNDQVLARLMRAAIEDPSQALAAVGVATCATVLRAAAGALPPLGGARVWLQRLPLMASFVGGVGAMWASVWVSANADRHRATGQIVLAVAVVNLLTAIGLTGSDPQIALNIVDTMV